MDGSLHSIFPPTTYRYWGDIPDDVKDMMLCHGCNLQAFDKDNSIVLPCAHVMCQKCVSYRVSKTATRDKVECPKCAEEWKIPLGNILAFPRDFFSLVLYNTLLGKSHGMVRPNPKCALHPREDVSRYCKECSVTVSNACRPIQRISVDWNLPVYIQMPYQQVVPNIVPSLQCAVFSSTGMCFVL